MANKPQKHIVEIDKDTANELADALATHGECYVSHIGKFTVKENAARPRYNFATKDTEHFPKSKRVVFSINAALKRAIS